VGRIVCLSSGDLRVNGNAHVSLLSAVRLSVSNKLRRVTQSECHCRPAARNASSCGRGLSDRHCQTAHSVIASASFTLNDHIGQPSPVRYFLLALYPYRCSPRGWFLGGEESTNGLRYSFVTPCSRHRVARPVRAAQWREPAPVSHERKTGACENWDGVHARDKHLFFCSSTASKIWTASVLP
jgi:hypothetical protein